MLFSYNCMAFISGFEDGSFLFFGEISLVYFFILKTEVGRGFVSSSSPLALWFHFLLTLTPAQQKYRRGGAYGGPTSLPPAPPADNGYC